jgi:hypothetical protein
LELKFLCNCLIKDKWRSSMVSSGLVMGLKGNVVEASVHTASSAYNTDVLEGGSSLSWNCLVL